jgi:hypothetical protein
MVIIRFIKASTLRRARRSLQYGACSVHSLRIGIDSCSNIAPGSLVRWFVLRPGDSALQWFDEERAQEMLRSNVATEMFSHLEVKEANAPVPSVPTEPPTYRVALEGGAVVVGYLIKRKKD